MAIITKSGSFVLQAACGCDKGRIRSRNEDNLIFDGKLLEQDHEGLRTPIVKKFNLNNEQLFAVFDGMGGEDAGEVSSFAAANVLKNSLAAGQEYLVDPRTMYEKLCADMNDEVCRISEQIGSGRMGTTFVSLYFAADEVYLCNIGDSKAFRLRDNALLQLSKDHVEDLPEGVKHKPKLSQHLGIFPEELTLEPYIAKGDLREGDQYLLCSDGLTDMLSNMEICAILKDTKDIKKCVSKLINRALENGGKDNITVIICRIK